MAVETSRTQFTAEYFVPLSSDDLVRQLEPEEVSAFLRLIEQYEFRIWESFYRVGNLSVKRLVSEMYVKMHIPQDSDSEIYRGGPHILGNEQVDGLTIYKIANPDSGE
jgi:hypothetical protein